MQYAMDQDSLDFWGKHKRILGRLTLDSSYATPGYALDEDLIGVGPLESVRVIGGNSVAGTLIYAWDEAGKKLMILYPTGGAEDSPSAIAYPAVALAGSGGDPATSTITPGQGKEVADSTDLSSVQILCEFIGKG